MDTFTLFLIYYVHLAAMYEKRHNNLLKYGTKYIQVFEYMAQSWVIVYYLTVLAS